MNPEPVSAQHGGKTGDVVPLRTGDATRGEGALPRTRVSLPSLGTGWRSALVVCGVVNVGLGIPQMLGVAVVGTAAVDTAHVVRDGVLACVLGFVCLAFAYRPRWGRPLTVVAVLTFVLQIVSGVTDVSVGRVQVAFESLHVVGALSVAICALALLRTAPKISRV